jgi:addiction module RelE/StbE family toxin
MIEYTVIITQPAENDLNDIYNYIAYSLQSPLNALRTVEAIHAALSRLSNMPERCAAVDDERISYVGYRKLHIKNYIAFFTIDNCSQIVNIERIMYARRNWACLL